MTKIVDGIFYLLLDTLSFLMWGWLVRHRDIPVYRFGYWLAFVMLVSEAVRLVWLLWYN